MKNKPHGYQGSWYIFLRDWRTRAVSSTNNLLHSFRLRSLHIILSLYSLKASNIHISRQFLSEIHHT